MTATGEWPEVADRLARDILPQPRRHDDACPSGDVVDEDLLARLRDGDEAAFGTLFVALQPRLVRYAATLVGGEAEDITSEAWLQIARDLGSFSGSAGALRGWAVSIVRHRALDHLRQRSRRPRSSATDEVLVERPGLGGTAESAEETWSTEAAMALIRTLPREQAEAVALRVVLGLDVAETAAVLGKRQGAVRVLVHRGLKTLATRVDPDA